MRGDLGPRGCLVGARHREDEVRIVLRMRYGDAGRLQPARDGLGIIAPQARGRSA